MRFDVTQHDLQRVANARGLPREEIERAVRTVAAGKHLVITSRSPERGLLLAEGLCSLAATARACIGSLTLNGTRAHSLPFTQVVAEPFVDQVWVVLTGADSSTLLRASAHIDQREPNASWRAILVARRSARSLVHELGEEILDRFAFMAVA